MYGLSINFCCCSIIKTPPIFDRYIVPNIDGIIYFFSALVIHGGTGVKEEDVKKVINLGIRKFNVGTELLVGWNKKAKECYDKNKENISNRENVVPCLNTIDEIVERKINLFKNIK